VEYLKKLGYASPVQESVARGFDLSHVSNMYAVLSNKLVLIMRNVK